LLILAAVVGASALRSAGLLVQDMWRFQEFLGGDRMTHFLMGGALMMAGFLVTLPRSVRRALWLASLVVVLLFLEEASQLAMATREFNWMDFGMGAAGACLALVVLSALYTLCLLLFPAGFGTEDDIPQ